MPANRAVKCPACGRTYDRRSAHNCPAAAAAPRVPDRYPLEEIPHAGRQPRCKCDRCEKARVINERRITVFDLTPGAGPWPGTCAVAGCRNMVITEDLCNEHYCERWQGRRRTR